MGKDGAFVIVATLVLNLLLGFSLYLEPAEPPDPPDTWEELFETGEQFRESSYSTFIGVLSSANRPLAVREGEVLYGQFLALDISYRVNGTVFLVDKAGVHVPLAPTQALETFEGLRIGERVKVKGYPDYGPDVDGRRYRTLIVDSIERLDEENHAGGS